MLGFKSINTVKNDELDVVVGLFDDEIDERACGCFYRSGVLRENGESGCGFVFDDVRVAVEQLED